MALSGFEGFEKRLELHFVGDGNTLMGLRLLDFDSLVKILDAVQCTIVCAVGSRCFDSYVLSESSLFVFPTKIIIKTCGTTQLLKAISPLISRAYRQLGFSCSSCRYTRGSFIFPEAQPFPHTSFADEVRYIEDCLPKALSHRKSSVMSSKAVLQSWHVFHASASENDLFAAGADEFSFTVEVCMTGLDPVLARRFFLPHGAVYHGGSSGKEMTKITGIGDINPTAMICDFAFDPCGYSMNGIDGGDYSTIHVTPEDGYSYASFECSGPFYGHDDVEMTLKKAVQVFRPACVSISTTSRGCMVEEMRRRVSRAAEMLGLKRRSCSAGEFPGDCNIVFQTFIGRRKHDENDGGR